MRPDRTLTAVASALRAVALRAVVIGNSASMLNGARVTTQAIDLLIRDTRLNRRKLAQAIPTCTCPCLRIRPRPRVAPNLFPLHTTNGTRSRSWSGTKCEWIRRPLGRDGELTGAAAGEVRNARVAVHELEHPGDVFAAIVEHGRDEVLRARLLAGIAASGAVGAPDEGRDAGAGLEAEVAGEGEGGLAEQAGRVVVIADEQAVVRVEADAAARA